MRIIRILPLLLMILSAPPSNAAQLYHPFERQELNILYNLLFCDDIDLFRSEVKAHPSSPFGILLDEKPDLNKIKKIAYDQSMESRYRALAFTLLRAAGTELPPQVLLAVIIEVPLPEGHSVLAVYPDGGVRHITPNGSFSVFDNIPLFLKAKVTDLMAASLTAVNKTGPTMTGRRPPPSPGNLRISFVASDGLYFGEGSNSVIEMDPITGPIMHLATEILRLTLDLKDN